MKTADAKKKETNLNMFQIDKVKKSRMAAMKALTIHH